MVQANRGRLSARTGAVVVASLAVPSLVMAALAVTTTGAAEVLRVTRHEHAASLIVSMAGTVIRWLPTTTL